MAWRTLIDTHDPDAPERWLALADPSGFEPAPRSFSQKRERRAAASTPERPRVETIDKLASAAGIAAEWSDIGGKRTIVSPETKIALLSGLGLEVASEAQARDSLTRLIDETQRRRLPFSLVLRPDEPLVAPCAT